MKNKTISSIINIFIGLSVVIASISISFPVSAQSQNEIIIPFSELGVSEIVMQGPYDSASVYFSLPDNWQLLEGTAIELYVQAFITREDGISSPNNEFVGAVLNVNFNQHLQQSISLIAGDETAYLVPIRAEDLNTENRDGRIQISFFLNAGIDCDYKFRKTIIRISPASNVKLSHVEVSPDLDLRNLPRPIFKRDSYSPEITKVVVPDEASADELRAAFLVMAAFGRMTNREMQLELITSEQLTPLLREESNLIFVGKPSSFPELSQLEMPVPTDGNKFDSSAMQPDDGLVQMFISPWNQFKTVIVVGGNTDEGVVKASQAVTTGNLQTGPLPTVSLVAQVTPLENQVIQGDTTEPFTERDYTLADFGYTIQRLVSGGNGIQSGIGTQWFGYEFSIPAGQSVVNESYFDLIFSHSTLIDPNRSEINVYINGYLAGSASFNEEDTSFVQKRINISPSLFRPGRNTIDIGADLYPRDACTTLNLNGLWMSIYPESFLHLPLTGTLPERSQLLELQNYPYPFLEDPSMSDLTVVLPQTDTAGWTSLGEVIYNLGGRATGEVVLFDVAFSEELSEDERQNNLILFGVPTELLLEDELNAALPAPFEQNSNVAILDNQTVVYRIEPNKSLGYLELLESPWGEGKTVLAILGTNSEGLSFSKQALMDSKIRSALKGNFATIDGEQFAIVDTRSGLGLGSFSGVVGSNVVEEALKTPETGYEQSDAPPFDLTRQYIPVVLVSVIGMIILVIIIAFILRKRDSSNSKKT